MREKINEMLRLAGSQARAGADEFLEQLHSTEVARPILPGSWFSPALRRSISEFFRHPLLAPPMALQAACLCGDLLAHSRPIWVMPEALENLQRWWESHGQACDLAGFASIWKTWGNPESDFLGAFKAGSWEPPWPILENDFLNAYISSQEDWLLERVPAWVALTLLGRLVPLSAAAEEVFWQAALEEPRKERELAQAYLQRQGAVESRLLQALRHSQAGLRQRAAEWAGRLRLESTVPQLSAALAKEKVERARMAQMESLRQLGAPLDVYLNRPALLQEARKRLAKEEPSWLRQLPLPKLFWKDDGQRLETELLKGWLLAAVALKQPQPTGLLSLVAPYLEEESRRRWGVELLDWWIARDTTPTYSAAEVEALWPQQAATLKNMYAMLNMPKSDQALEAEARRHLEQSVDGSAIELKGLLAVAGAFAGDGVLAAVRAYLKKWYGLRAAQCKALLAMLGCIEGPGVVQYLLEVAGRFRTKGIQQEAQRVLRERAERSGWSLEELADLSIPTGGLDEGGHLRLQLGDREVVAGLQPDLSWQLRDDSGKVLKSLPACEDKLPGTLYKAAQKSVKEVQKSLRERLYEAMCSGRSWGYSAWETSLRSHPIAARLLQGLVWLARRKDELKSFRPDLDGSLLTVDHDTLQLDESWLVELAHPLRLSPAELAGWHTHLSDYRLMPCFAQLMRPTWVKPPIDTEDFPFYGHLLGSFQLRNRAQALGYVRAPAQDGGIFEEYRKSLAGVGWTVRLRFTGSALPETSHPVALLELIFEQQGQPARWPDIPALLYSEAMADAQEIAREGSGFDPDWQRKASVN